MAARSKPAYADCNMDCCNGQLVLRDGSFFVLGSNL